MVVRIGNVDVTLHINGHAARPVELRRPGALSPPLGDWLPLVGEQLDPVVARIRDVDGPLRIDRQAVWLCEPPGAIAFTTPLGNEPTISGERLHTVVTGIGQVDVPLLIDGHSGRHAKLARLGALRPPTAEFLT